MAALRFTAKVLTADRGGAYIAIDDPTREALGGGGRIPVRATFNGVEYRGSICKMDGIVGLGLTRDVREAAKAEPGTTVRVTLERDLEERTVELPAPLATALALKKNTKADDAFAKLSYSHKREYVRWIDSAKREETRTNRVAKAIEMLHAGTKTPDAR
jgi:bacteriocin resistance YdeI/OmpD-like protein/uncharacterized protein DUF1905